MIQRISKIYPNGMIEYLYYQSLDRKTSEFLHLSGFKTLIVQNGTKLRFIKVGRELDMLKC